jgi:N-acetylglucosaminyldiphosphoundecaprenol N-acetyl-beta-D-mannosaminyltransferase
MNGSRQTLPSIRILGSRVNMVQTPQAVDTIRQWIASGERTCRHVVVTGMHGLIEGHKDRSFRAVLNAADLFVPDGISAVWIARLCGHALAKRVTGHDLMRGSLEMARQQGLRSFFYGDTTKTLDRMVGQLRVQFPGVQVAGTFSPPFRALSAREDEDIVRMINRARPDILWVGLGLPKQERWIAEHRHRLRVPVAIGVGAGFKFMAGAVQRAPAWIGDHGFEWLWRFVHEPRAMWRRDFIDGPRFVVNVAAELLHGRRHAEHQAYA